MIVELRQYTLHPGRRDALVTLFDREFVESQEAIGAAVLGQFRDLDDPDRFVWLRGFPDMPSRAASLAAFYGGPVWLTHRDEANATMVDFDDVLLLRRVTGFPAPAPRPPAGSGSAPGSAVLATIWLGKRPFDDAAVDFFDAEVRPALREAGAEPFGLLRSEYAENTFPALPVRAGEHALVWFARFPSPAALDDHLRRLDGSARRRERVRPVLDGMRHLRLAPTARSALR